MRASASARNAVLALTLLAGCGGTSWPGSIGLIARHDPDGGRIVVQEVPAGLSAARAGLEVGDEIVAVDGKPVAEMTSRQFREAVRGDVGTTVELTIRRDGVLRKVKVERGPLK